MRVRAEEVIKILFAVAHPCLSSYIPILMTDLETINVSNLMDASGGDREIAISLVCLYFELTGTEITKLEEAVRTGNAPVVSAVAHKCAGSSSSCGMPALAALLKTLEKASAQGMPTNAPEQLQEIGREMSAVRTAFETHFGCSFPA
jgi:HPt (histidine-containing phosphotransfer) domain-containing protein